MYRHCLGREVCLYTATRSVSVLALFYFFLSPISFSLPSLSLSGSGPWHYPSGITLPTGEPCRPPASTGTPLLFSWMSHTNGEMTEFAVCVRTKKKRRVVLSWLTGLKLHLLTNKQQPLQINTFAKNRESCMYISVVSGMPTLPSWASWHWERNIFFKLHISKPKLQQQWNNVVSGLRWWTKQT